MFIYAISCKLVIIQAKLSVRILVLWKRNQLWNFCEICKQYLNTALAAGQLDIKTIVPRQSNGSGIELRRFHVIIT